MVKKKKYNFWSVTICNSEIWIKPKVVINIKNEIKAEKEILKLLEWYLEEFNVFRISLKFSYLGDDNKPFTIIAKDDVIYGEKEIDNLFISRNYEEIKYIKIIKVYTEDNNSKKRLFPKIDSDIYDV